MEQPVADCSKSRMLEQAFLSAQWRKVRLKTAKLDGLGRTLTCGIIHPEISSANLRLARFSAPSARVFEPPVNLDRENASSREYPS